MMVNDPDEIKMEALLNDGNAETRRQTLRRLRQRQAASADLAVECGNVNMHIHSFFSFNAQGWSPTRIVWETRKARLYAAGLCDFDTLAGLEEFLAAACELGMRAAVNIETRAYVADLADKEISSPGEPGVAYVMGLGFGSLPPPGSQEAAGLEDLRARADARNRALVARVNAALSAAAIAYEEDAVAPMPGGLPTERQLVRAYLRKAQQGMPDAGDLCRFWADTLAMDEAATQALMADEGAFEEKVRARLVKRGGLGYEAPSPKTFPAARAFMDWVRRCGAIPTVAWLDGTSAGEADARAYLEEMRAQGAAAINIVPDRNWNIGDPSVRALKIRKLGETVAAAEALDFPVNIGTEMNRKGLPFADRLDGEVLRPYKEVFLRGARVVVGQTRLARWADYGYAGEQAQSEYPAAADRNRFFAQVGALPALDSETETSLREMGPVKALAWLRDRAQAAGRL